MSRCFGFSSNLKLCKRQGSWWFFCHDHKRQWLIWISFVVFTMGGGGASIFGVIKSTPDAERITNASPLVIESVINNELVGEERIVFALPVIDHSLSVHFPILIKNTTITRIQNIAITLILNSKYIHSFPARKGNKAEILGSLRVGDLDRRVNHIGTLSSSTTMLRGLNGKTSLVIEEPLVWTKKYLNEIASGNAPIVDIEIRVTGDGILQSSFIKKLQAVNDIAILKGVHTYHPPPFLGFNGKITMIRPEMMKKSHKGKPFYVAKPLVSKYSLITIVDDESKI